MFMKRFQFVVLLLLIIAVIVFVIANIEYSPKQKEYFNQKCPKQQNGSDDFLFFHPLNRLIASL